METEITSLLYLLHPKGLSTVSARQFLAFEASLRNQMPPSLPRLGQGEEKAPPLALAVVFTLRNDGDPL